MTQKSGKSVADRRSFIKLAGLGGVASGAALIAGQAVAETDEVTADDKSLYRETDHVKTYYKLARF